MKTKSILTYGLLAFVAISIVYLVAKETGGRETKAEEHSAKESSEQSSAIVAYYFYGNVRCQTCRTIEAYTAETVTNAFAEEIGDGRLQWKTVNTDEAENEHFINDYDLKSRSVILVDMVNGKQGAWTNLTQIWDLVDDKAAFQKYIADEIRGFLAGGDE